jgi:beta-glucosidase
LAQRVADLVGRMTLQEKIEQLDCASPGVPRLGIPAYNWWSEGIRGVSRAGRSTMFPHAIAMAATWDTDLVFRIATAVSDEARAKHREAPAARYHGLTFWAPATDPARDPRWGRVMETYGEDPYLVGRMAVAYIRGLQGDDPKYLKVAACVKHAAGHGQETGRHETIFTIAPRPLREYYLPPFRDGVVEAKAALCMAAYSGLNGFPCMANKWLLTDLLRQEWGFEGVVASDWEAPFYLKLKYNLAESHEKALSMALAAGTDVFFQQFCVSTNVLRAAQSGFLPEAVVDRALSRALAVRFRLGAFDPPDKVPWAKIPDSVVGRKEHVALSREAGRASTVLLKNAKVPGRADPSPVLPLNPRRIDSIAVLGPYADRLEFGTYESEATAEPVVTFFRGLAARAGDRVVVRTVPWFDIDDPKRRAKERKPDPRRAEELRMGQKASLEAAIKLAAQSDVAVVALGLGRKNEFEGKDRLDLSLPKEQQEFVEKVVEANPATVAVLVNGGPLATPWLQENVPAIVECWYPGEQAGHSLADVLFGDHNPAGRLPVTVYASLEQVAPLGDYEVSHGQTYLWFAGKPLYPFGHGLSYTRFEYSNLRLDRDRLGPNDTLHASVDVRNVGDRDGDEVVQAYARRVESSVPMPLKQLVAFRRVRVPAGQVRTVSLAVRASELRHWDEARNRFVVEAAPCELQVGASSADIRAKAGFRIQ